jgi:hypothetical protein
MCMMPRMSLVQALQDQRELLCTVAMPSTRTASAAGNSGQIKRWLSGQEFKY